MHTLIKRRQLRGLVLHHRRHPSTHPRRIVHRTARWKEPPVNGVCRWCYELTAGPKTRWHPYCLSATALRSNNIPMRSSTRSARCAATRPTRWTTGWRQNQPVRWDLRRCFMRSLRGTEWRERVLQPGSNRRETIGGERSPRFLFGRARTGSNESCTSPPSTTYAVCRTSSVSPDL